MKTERAERLICMIASSIIALMLLTCLAMNAEASSCSLKIDGVIIESDAAPIIENNTTLVPIAVIADYLGGTSSWDQEAQQATIKNGNTTVVLTNRSKNATVNGVSYTLTTAPRIVTVDADGGGRTMVPLRFIAEAFGYDVDWDDSTRTAIVNTDQAKQEITITGIKVQTNQTYSGSGKYTLVSITADKSLKYGGYKTVMLSDPYRCYVDIASSKLGSGVKDQLVDADKSYVSKVRTGVTGSTYCLSLSLLLAFAMLYPEVQVLLFFVIPIRVKYFGFFAAALWVLSFLGAPLPQKLSLLLSMANVWLFFGPMAYRSVRAWVRREQWKRRNRR